ncbi:SDR family oxidoreductase [Microbacterium sp. SD291]|uniref:SDR family NAD(P)-dependent oxidoreductase n=1 Tax=Microbacterium sp. SD291 TaxID=2782007 RepID=UPI001A962376|nr:SDR family oxidoreductase [Microbacterium sp. SD291]MBO0982137.1 SDR family oxidoreductase [Microbacterium sp. SD291]
MRRDFTDTTALITGASSGLGAEFAAQLARRGADVVLVARREERLRELSEDITREHGVRATPIALDLAAPDAPAALRAQLDERGIRIHTLINNAGFGSKGAFVDADAARIAEMIQVNVASLVGLTREFLPDLVSDGRGALVNLASIAAYQPCPGMAVYGASKAFVLSFTEAIAHETAGSGLRVLALSPGATATEFFEVVGTRPFTSRFEAPETVVALAMRLLDRRRTPASVVSGRLNALFSRLAGIVPRRLVLAASGRLLTDWA